MSKAQQLYSHAKKRIPGGVQLLSKSPNILPVAAVRSSKSGKEEILEAICGSVCNSGFKRLLD